MCAGDFSSRISRNVLDLLRGKWFCLLATCFPTGIIFRWWKLCAEFTEPRISHNNILFNSFQYSPVRSLIPLFLIFS